MCNCCEVFKLVLMPPAFPASVCWRAFLGNCTCHQYEPLVSGRLRWLLPVATLDHVHTAAM